MVYVYYRKLIIEMKFPYEENDCNYFSNSKISIYLFISYYIYTIISILSKANLC